MSTNKEFYILIQNSRCLGYGFYFCEERCVTRRRVHCDDLDVFAFIVQLTIQGEARRAGTPYQVLRETLEGQKFQTC